MEPYDTLLDQLPGWSVTITELEGVIGYCDIAAKKIYVDIWLTDRERRSTIMHEVVHALHGDRRDDPCTEARTQQVAAELLIPTSALRAVLRHATHPQDICDELFVDLDTLQTRVRTLPPADRHVIRRALTNVLDPDPRTTRCAISRWWTQHHQPDPNPCEDHCCESSTRKDIA